VDAEIPSPVAGVLTEIKTPAGETVEVNTVVAVISGASGVAGTASGAKASAPAAATLRHPPSRCRSQARSATVTPKTELAPTPLAQGSGERQRSSPLVRRIAKENNLDLSQVAGPDQTGASPRKMCCGT